MTNACPGTEIQSHTAGLITTAMLICLWKREAYGGNRFTASMGPAWAGTAAGTLPGR